jgi:hypothetical protein
MFKICCPTFKEMCKKTLRDLNGNEKKTKSYKDK